MSRQPYHVHVIIPCYKDSLTDMKNTLLSALSATMPPGCTRTIFLVDDSQASRLQGLPCWVWLLQRGQRPFAM